jgi:hypothetical protein
LSGCARAEGIVEVGRESRTQLSTEARSRRLCMRPGAMMHILSPLCCFMYDPRRTQARDLGLCFLRAFLLRVLQEPFCCVTKHECLQMHVTRECGVPCRTWWTDSARRAVQHGPPLGWGVSECCTGETSITLSSVRSKMMSPAF